MLSEAWRGGEGGWGGVGGGVGGWGEQQSRRPRTARWASGRHVALSSVRHSAVTDQLVSVLSLRTSWMASATSSANVRPVCGRRPGHL